MSKRNRPISPVEFVLVSLSAGLFVLLGLQFVFGKLIVRSPAAVAPLAAQVLPSPTPTALPTWTFTPAPSATSVVLPTQDLPPTWTATPTWTPTPTYTPTPTPSPTPTKTSKPPLIGLRPTVTLSATGPISGTEFMTGLDVSVGPFLPTPAPMLDLPQNTINIALLGSDQRPDSSGWRTDVIIVVSINPDIPSVNLYSIPRDTWAYIPNWRYTRINLADSHGEAVKFPGGGPGLVEQTLQYNFGIPVQYFARVNFDGFKTLIDAVGGVDVVADCPLYDIFPDAPPGVSDIGYTDITGTIDIPIAGVYHFDGKHALWYARSRKTTSDFDRSRRQQRVLRALWQKIQEQGLVSRLPDIWNDLINTVQTDLSLNDVIYLANLGQRIDRSLIKNSFLDGQYAHRFTSEEGASVFYFVYDEISDTLKTAFQPNINRAGNASASIEVLNGTANANWDLVGADKLNWAGYRVTSTGPADRSDYANTVIYDLRSTTKGSRLSELARIFNVARDNLIAQPDPNAGVEYRIVLGADWNPCQRASVGVFPARTPTPMPTP
jgi:LCP family protein required for cell wall assembly